MKIIPLSEIEAKNANFVLTDFLPIPENAVTLLSASGGIGKTRLSLIMADRYVQTNDRNATLWLTEDFDGQVRHTFNEMIKHKLVSKSSLEKIHLILDSPPQLAKREKGLFKANYEEINKIGEELIKANSGFAVFDPLLAFYGGNENDNSEARVFIQSFAEWAKDAHVTTLIIHHANKDGGSRGATAFHDGVRARYEIKPPMTEDNKINQGLYKKGIRTITLMKDNWGVRKFLYKLTDGDESMNKQIMPPLFTDEPEVVEYDSVEIPDLGL